MQNIDKLLKESGLSHKKEGIMSSLKTAIKMNKEKTEEINIPIGASKLGGLPDLPKELDFPRYQNRYLFFMGQFNLREIKPFDQDDVFPNEGILYLFYDAYEQPWGFEEDEGCFEVLYYDGDETLLKRREYPEITEDYHPLKTVKLSFSNMYTISESPEDVEFETDKEEECFWEFKETLIETPAHYLLGEPYNIQNDVFDELYDYPKEPLLLFQIDSDEDDLDVMWGDSGILYFCIEKDELKNKEFDKVKFTLQCC